MKKVGAPEKLEITKEQLAGIISAAQTNVRRAICELFDGSKSGSRSFEFSEMVGHELMREAGIRLHWENPESGNAFDHGIILNGRDIEKMVVLQDSLWREGIRAGVSVDLVVEKLTAATLRFLGIKAVDRHGRKMRLVA